MKLTVISNVYNEEYLLPFWLEHHRTIFDHGIVVNFKSTDKSMDIVREMCPSWDIIESPIEFDVLENDKQFMRIERTVDDYKIVLNTTEFLFCSVDIRKLIEMRADCYYPIPSYMPFSSKINTEPETLKDILNDIEKVGPPEHWRQWRFLHSYNDGHYGAGRHDKTLPVTNDIAAFILWLGWHPWNERLIKRKIQIKDKMLDSDVQAFRGWQHTWNREQQEERRNHYYSHALPVANYREIKKTIDLFIQS